jgi:hypothetical protein
MQEPPIHPIANQDWIVHRHKGIKLVPPEKWASHLHEVGVSDLAGWTDARDVPTNLAAQAIRWLKDPKIVLLPNRKQPIYLGGVQEDVIIHDHDSVILHK